VASSPRRRIDRRRRAQIGAEKRARTRAMLITAALTLFGRPHGRNTRIEDVCARARISRGTFYNYFDGIEQLLEALSDALTRDFDAAVHTAFASLDTATERTCAALRYYLHAPRVDPRWGWAIVNSSVGSMLYGENITSHVRDTIQQGIDAGEFRIASADVGRDILLGTGISATVTLLGGAAPRDYPEQVTRHLLLALGAPAQVAARVTGRPMSDLPQLTTSSEFFRGVLGGRAHASRGKR
jgi:AcrR family transcriptional regulator